MAAAVFLRRLFAQSHTSMTTASTSLSHQRKLPLPTQPTRVYPKPLWFSILLTRYIRDYLSYRKTGSTTAQACVNLRRLFRLTNGRFNDLVARLDGLLHPPRVLSYDAGAPGIVGMASDDSLSRITANLRADGLHLFSTRLPKEMCQRLRHLAETTPCHVESSRGVHPEPAIYDPNTPLGTRYKVDKQTLHEEADIQRLVTDASLLNIAQAYFGCQPVFIGCQLWWSTTYSQQACSKSAQLYHFDMPQIKFLKIFAYLTDVDENTGPHRFVRGSHRRNPAALREDRRYRDEEILAHYPPDRIAAMTGPTGTIFAEDTRGFHKGTPVHQGHRLVLQLQYATSGFGGLGEPIIVNDRFSTQFIQMMDRYPRIYSARFLRNAK